MSVQRAAIRDMRAPLAESFGQELLAKKFGQRGALIVLEAIGTFRSGKNKGKPRGFLHWRKCDVGGWGYENNVGRVFLPGSYDYGVGLTYDRTRVAPGRAECPSSCTEAQYLEMLMRALGRITGTWNEHKDEPLSGFSSWVEVHETASAERAIPLTPT